MGSACINPLAIWSICRKLPIGGLGQTVWAKPVIVKSVAGK
jgi:hypothetical protein